MLQYYTDDIETEHDPCLPSASFRTTSMSGFLDHWDTSDYWFLESMMNAWVIENFCYLVVFSGAS